MWNDDGSGMPSLSSFIVISPKKLLVQIETTTAFDFLLYLTQIVRNGNIFNKLMFLHVDKDNVFMRYSCFLVNLAWNFVADFNVISKRRIKSTNVLVLS